MEEELHSCKTQFFTYFAIVFLGISGVLVYIGKNVYKKISGCTGNSTLLTPQSEPVKPVNIDIHEGIGELRRTTLQITKDWDKMSQLMNNLRDQQNCFVVHLESDLQSMHGALSTTLSSRLREEGVRTELRSAALARSVDSLAAELAQMREVVCQKEADMDAGKVDDVMPLVDGWTQTDVRKKLMDEKAMGMNDHPEAMKTIILAIKHALMGFLKEAQKNLGRDRKEMLESVRIIFTQLEESREDVKKTIAGAFSASTLQTQRCIEQLGLLGNDAIGALVARNDNAAAERFQALAAKTTEVSRSLQVVDINVASIKDSLDNIDGQFDEIYRKLELGQQANSEQCGEIAERMATAARDFEDKSDALDAKHRQLAEQIETLNESLNQLHVFEDCDEAVDDVQSLVNKCSKRMEMLMDTLEQFINRVERPMQQVVYQTKFLTEVIGNRAMGSQGAVRRSPGGQGLTSYIGDVANFHNDVGKPRKKAVMESNIKALMKEPDYDETGTCESETSVFSSVTFASTHTNLR